MDFAKSIKVEKNQKICIINMPIPFREELANLPEEVLITPRPVGKFNKVILFTNTKEELTKSWDRLMTVLNDGGEFWVVHPGKKNKVYNEINDKFLADMVEEKKAVMGKKSTLLIDWDAYKIIKPEAKK